MKNDVSFEKQRAFKSKLKLFYEMLFYFVSIAWGSLHFSFVLFLSFVTEQHRHWNNMNAKVSVWLNAK